MLIVCPSCATSYDVEPASLQPDGRKVRCVRCRTVWHAEPPRAEKLIAAAAALAPDPSPAELPATAEAVPSNPSIEPTGEVAAADAAAPTLDAEPHPEGGQLAQAPAAESAVAPSGAVEIEAPPIAPGDPDDDPKTIEIEAGQESGHSAAAVDDIESLAALRPRRSSAKRRRPAWALSRLQTVILALVVLDSVVVGWRQDIVRALPQTASLYGLIGMPVNLRGLVFDGVSTSIEHREGVPILVVHGDIVNVASAVVNVPRIRLALRNAAGQEIYWWTLAPAQRTLSPGLAFAFVSRLASPPRDSRDVVVRFLSRRDLVADAR
jgi:predicted Zn finger-like uncharacterized protein